MRVFRVLVGLHFEARGKRCGGAGSRVVGEWMDADGRFVGLGDAAGVGQAGAVGRFAGGTFGETLCVMASSAGKPQKVSSAAASGVIWVMLETMKVSP